MFTFEAKIYNVGINPCVDVPKDITHQMNPAKGLIPIVGEMQYCDFKQTLIPVKNGRYRLFVNELMLKRSKSKVGDTVLFVIGQDYEPSEILMPKLLEKELLEQNLLLEYNRLRPSRKSNILNYLNHLKSTEALFRNIKKVVSQLKRKKKEA